MVLCLSEVWKVWKEFKFQKFEKEFEKKASNPFLPFSHSSPAGPFSLGPLLFFSARKLEQAASLSLPRGPSQPSTTRNTSLLFCSLTDWVHLSGPPPSSSSTPFPLPCFSEQHHAPADRRPLYGRNAPVVARFTSTLLVSFTIFWASFIAQPRGVWCLWARNRASPATPAAVRRLSPAKRRWCCSRTTVAVHQQINVLIKRRRTPSVGPPWTHGPGPPPVHGCASRPSADWRPRSPQAMGQTDRIPVNRRVVVVVL
jgi:hypothetical protein